MKNCPMKVVVRRLPPGLKEPEFLKIVDPMPPHSYFRFCGPDPTLGNFGLCRAYITFDNLDALFDFKERFDQYVFVDSEGNESSAVVEFAICQALASNKDASTKKPEKTDKKQGTLHEDPEFLAFEKTLQSASANSESTENEAKKTPWEVVLEEIQNRDSAVDKSRDVTPLLAYINQRDLEHRRKEDDLMKPRKPFKQSPHVRQRKLSRGEPFGRYQPPQGRRGSESKRGQHGKGDEDWSAEQKHKSEQSAKSALDADDFPAMQGSNPKPVKQPVGPWAERPVVWSKNSPIESEKIGSSKPTVSNPVEASGNDVPTTPGTRSVSTEKNVVHREKPKDGSDLSDPAILDYGEPMSIGKWSAQTHYTSRTPSSIAGGKKAAKSRGGGHRASDNTFDGSGGEVEPALDYAMAPPHQAKGHRGRRGASHRGGNGAQADLELPPSQSGYSRGSYRNAQHGFRGRSNDYADESYRPPSEGFHTSGSRRGGASGYRGRGSSANSGNHRYGYGF